MPRLLLLSLLFFGFSLPTPAQKRVLLEKYTSAFCGACPNAHLVAEELAEKYPELVLVFHHSSVDGMGNPFSTEWREGFGLLATPLGIVGRQPNAQGQLALPHGQWEALIQQQLAEPAYAELELSGSYDPFSRQLSLDVNTTITDVLPAGELRLNLMIVEDSVIHAGFGFDQSNYFNEVEGHPLYGLGHPIYFYPHHHVLREIVDGTWGTAGVFPETPEHQLTYSHHYDYYVTYNWDHSQLKLVAFVSLYDETDPQQRKVLNVAEMPLWELLPTSTRQAGVQESIRAFPNPTTGQLRVELPEGTERLRVFSAAGLPVYELEGRGQDIIDIGLEGLPAGWYLLHVITDSGVAVKKISLH